MGTVIFATPQLENMFRKLVNKPVEVGGFLFFRGWQYEPVVDTRAMKRLYDSHTHEIESWMIVPNLSKTPENTWSTTPEILKSFKESADITAKSLGFYWVFFHSHPTGDSSPSNPDINFTLHHCQIWRDAGKQCIVSLNPLRVIQYGIERKPKQINIYESTYLSWRSKALRSMAKGEY